MANNFSILEGLPGVRTAVVGAADGSVLHAVGGVTVRSEEVSSLAAAFCYQMNAVGQILGLTACNFVVVRSERTAHVMIVRRGSTAALEVDPKRLTPELESRLRSLDWSAPAPRSGLVAPRTAPPAPPKLPQSSPSAQRSSETASGKFATPDAGVTGKRDTGATRIPSSVRSPEPAKRSEEQRPPPVSSLPPPPPSTGALPAVEGAKTGRSAAIGNEIMFRGDLALVCVPDLLEFFRAGQRTGRLVCTSIDAMGSVRIRKGKIVDASSPKTRKSGLLASLLESGDASEEQAKAVARGDEDQLDSVVVARRLIDGGFTNPEAVRRALLVQFQGAINEMIGWTEGAFTFYPGEEEAAPCEPVVEVDAQVILLQIFKEQDEAGH